MQCSRPQPGKFAPVHVNVEGQPRTIRFKALNAAARQSAAADTQARRQLFRATTRATQQKEFPEQASAAAKAKQPPGSPASPRPAPGKHKATERTGETPDAAVQKNSRIMPKR